MSTDSVQNQQDTTSPISNEIHSFEAGTNPFHMYVYVPDSRPLFYSSSASRGIVCDDPNSLSPETICVAFTSRQPHT